MDKGSSINGYNSRVFLLLSLWVVDIQYFTLQKKKSLSKPLKAAECLFSMRCFLLSFHLHLIS